MIRHDWGLITYELAELKMNNIHKQARDGGCNHLILCQHPNIYTLGQDAWNTDFDVNTYKTDRGGSISAHSPGQNIYYFCFHTPHPVLFYSKVIAVFEAFFKKYLPLVVYDKARPGFYLENKKLLSLGFRYKQGVSLHGIALNVCTDLDFHNVIRPCNLEGIRSSSLEAEGLRLNATEINEEIVERICEVFDESV